MKTTSHGNNSGSHLQEDQSKWHYQLQVRKMLLAVSSIFLLLNLPSHVIRMYDFFKGIADHTYSTSLTVIRLQKIFTYFHYVNFSINFLLYSFCGRKFRRALKGLVKRPRIVFARCCKKRNSRMSTRSVKSVVTTKV